MRLTAEQGTRQEVVAARVEFAQPRVLAIRAISDRDRMVLRQRQQANEVGEIELAVRIGEGDTDAAGRLEPGPQRPRVTEVPVMRTPPHARPRPCATLSNGWPDTSKGSS